MTEEQKQEKALLRERLMKMGINTSPNASIETLKKKYNDALEGKTSEPEREDTTGSKEETPTQLRERLYKENMRLIRCRIVNLNPQKRDLHGEIYTVANDVLGKVSKYVPWDEAGESYHLPYCIYKNLLKRKFLQIKIKKQRNGREIIEQQWVPEFNIEVLPPLTKEELEELAAQQRAGRNIDK